MVAPRTPWGRRRQTSKGGNRGRCGEAARQTLWGFQSVVTDAVEALRQNVDEEAADELAGGQRHDLLALATIGTIVLPSEGNAVVADCDQSAVGDGDAVGIARQIGQHGLRPTERALGTDDPLGPTQRCQIRHERLRVGEGGMIAEELQTADLMVYSTIS